MMKNLCSILAATILLFAANTAYADSARIGEVVTTWKNWYKPGAESDKIIVDRFDDPKVKNVSCYVSRAVTGGYLATVGMAEDPSQFSIACRSTGKVELGQIDRSKSGEQVFSESASALFKSIKVVRVFDPEKNILLYLVYSTKLIDGSPSNSLSAVPIE
jgi:CreA protein